MSIQLLKALAQVITLQEGLAELGEDGILEAILPQPVARTLKVPSDVTFSTQANSQGCTFVGYSSEIFENCETLLGEQGCLTSFGVEYQGYLKQSGFEKLVASTLIPQNGLLRVGEAIPAWTPYCRFNVAYTAEAAEKRLGLVSFWLNGFTGVSGVEVGDALLWESDRIPVPEGVELDSSLWWPIVEQVSESLIKTELAPWCHSLERKLSRDDLRLREYYQTIIQEIEGKCAKKKLEGEAKEVELNRIEATQWELKRKLADLKQRYALTVTAQVHSVMVVWLQTVQIECSLKHKKQQRTIRAVYNPYTHLLEPLRCEKTNLPVTQFVLDDQMRILSPDV